MSYISSAFCRTKLALPIVLLVAMFLSGCNIEVGSGAGKKPNQVEASGTVVMGATVKEFNGGFVSMGSKEIPNNYGVDASLDLYVMHLDQCAENQRSSSKYCVTLEELALKKEMFVSGDAQVGFRFAKIKVDESLQDESLQDKISSSEVANVLLTWKTGVAGLYYDCSSPNGAVDYTFVPQESAGTKYYEATFTGNVQCHYCNKVQDELSGEWRCEYDVSRGDPEDRYVVGSLTAPYFEPDEVGTVFGMLLEQYLTLYVHFFSQLFPQ